MAMMEQYFKHLSSRDCEFLHQDYKDYQLRSQRIKKPRGIFQPDRIVSSIIYANLFKNPPSYPPVRQLCGNASYVLGPRPSISSSPKNQGAA